MLVCVDRRWCQRCQRTCEAQHRYMLGFAITDHTGREWITAFNVRHGSAPLLRVACGVRSVSCRTAQAGQCAMNACMDARCAFPCRRRWCAAASTSCVASPSARRHAASPTSQGAIGRVLGSSATRNTDLQGEGLRRLTAHARHTPLPGGGAAAAGLPGGGDGGAEGGQQQRVRGAHAGAALPQLPLQAARQ